MKKETRGANFGQFIYTYVLCSFPIQITHTKNIEYRPKEKKLLFSYCQKILRDDESINRKPQASWFGRLLTTAPFC